MTRSFEEFVEASLAVTTREQLKDLFSQVLAGEGFDNHIMTTIAERRVGSVAWHKFPDGYAETYIAEQWQQVDPILAHTLNARRPFRWNDAAQGQTLSVAERNCLEACREIGVHSGIAIPLFGPGSRRDVISISQRDTAELDTKRLPILYAICAQAWYRFIDLGGDWPDTVGLGVKFTNRETEVLQWVKSGKSNHDIADIMHVSVRTVEFHLLNMMNKLGAPNRIALVVMALQLGLIRI